MKANKEMRKTDAFVTYIHCSVLMIVISTLYLRDGSGNLKGVLTYNSIMYCVQARIQRGDRGSGPPPLRFVRGGVLCRGLMGRRGGSNGCVCLIIIIFSGSLRSPVAYKHIPCIHTSKFNVQYGTVILFYISLIQFIEPTFPPLLL